MPDINTIGDSLFWSYANLAMAHSAVKNNQTKYKQLNYIIRSRLFHGLKKGTMSLGSILDDEKLKMKLPQVCSYCGGTDHLSVDHLIPKAKGGLDTAENMVWACRSCNSSKSATDFLVWHEKRGVFPPLMLLRRYLKIAIEICQSQELLGTTLDEAPSLPFVLEALPHKYPKPNELVLWVEPAK